MQHDEKYVFRHTNLVEWLGTIQKVCKLLNYFELTIRTLAVRSAWDNPTSLAFLACEKASACTSCTCFLKSTDHSKWKVISQTRLDCHFRQDSKHFLYRDLFNPNSRRSTWACKPGSGTWKIFKTKWSYCLLPFESWDANCRLATHPAYPKQILCRNSPTSHPFTNFTNACGEEIDEPYTLKRDVTR